MDGEHLMRLQSGNTVIKFLCRSTCGQGLISNNCSEWTFDANCVVCYCYSQRGTPETNQKSGVVHLSKTQQQILFFTLWISDQYQNSPITFPGRKAWRGKQKICAHQWWDNCYIARIWARNVRVFIFRLMVAWHWQPSSVCMEMWWGIFSFV